MSVSGESLDDDAVASAVSSEAMSTNAPGTCSATIDTTLAKMDTVTLLLRDLPTRIGRRSVWTLERMATTGESEEDDPANQALWTRECQSSCGPAWRTRSRWLVSAGENLFGWGRSGVAKRASSASPDEPFP